MNPLRKQQLLIVLGLTVLISVIVKRYFCLPNGQQSDSCTIVLAPSEDTSKETSYIRIIQNAPIPQGESSVNTLPLGQNTHKPTLTAPNQNSSPSTNNQVPFSHFLGNWDEANDTQKAIIMRQIIDDLDNAVPALRFALSNGTASQKILACKLLGRLEDIDSLQDIIHILEDSPDCRTMLVASYAVGQIQNKGATPILLKMASSATTNATAARAGIIALGLLRKRDAIPVLKKLLSENSDPIAVTISGSLGLLGDKTGFDRALQAIQSEDSHLRLHAIQALGFIGDRGALPILTEMLGHGSSFTEQKTIQLAIFMIKQHELPETTKINAIKNHLNLHQDALTVNWCLNELLRIGGRRSVDALQSMANDQRNLALTQQSLMTLKLLLTKEKLSKTYD